MIVEQERGEPKTFDVMSSVYLLRFDEQVYGAIQPETMQRVMDEELTYIAEGIDRPMRTEFVLKEQDGQLVYFNQGKWEPYMAMLRTGLETAKLEASQDFRKQFLVVRAEHDLIMGEAMQQLQPGESEYWYSTYPDEEARKHGEEFVSKLGYQPKRRLGFLYEARRNEDGSVSLTSQSVDNSDEESFQFATERARRAKTMDDFLDAYDESLEQKFGKHFVAGRDPEQVRTQEDAWQIVLSNKDIVDYFMQELIAISEKNIPLQELEVHKKRLTYGVWAAIRERLDRTASAPQARSEPAGTTKLVELEIQKAYQLLSARGEILFGCGGEIKGEEALFNASSEEVFDAIFGERNQSQETLVWRKGVCRIDNCPTRPGKTEVAQCQICRGCQKMFDSGKDPIKEHQLRRQQAPNN